MLITVSGARSADPAADDILKPNPAGVEHKIVAGYENIQPFQG
jgi:hypothetical protein